MCIGELIVNSHCFATWQELQWAWLYKKNIDAVVSFSDGPMMTCREYLKEQMPFLRDWPAIVEWLAVEEGKKCVRRCIVYFLFVEWEDLSGILKCSLLWMLILVPTAVRVASNCLLIPRFRLFSCMLNFLCIIASNVAINRHVFLAI